MSTNSVDAINALNNFSAQADNGIITVTIDQADRKMNVIGDGFNDFIISILQPKFTSAFSKKTAWSASSIKCSVNINDIGVVCHENANPDDILEEAAKR